MARLVHLHVEDCSEELQHQHPAVLCHKEPARTSSSHPKPLLGALLVAGSLLHKIAGVAAPRNSPRHGGGQPWARFSAAESFHGRLTRLDIWSRALTHQELLELKTECEDYLGDLLGWPDVYTGLRGEIKVGLVFTSCLSNN